MKLVLCIVENISHDCMCIMAELTLIICRSSVSQKVAFTFRSPIILCFMFLPSIVFMSIS